MNKIISSVLAVCVPLLAMAHHSVTPIFDTSRTITAAGTVTAFRLMNPHATLSLESIDDAGNTVVWTIELDGRTNLSGFGWNDDTIRVGERITVTGNPTHSGSPRMWFVSLERANGETLRRPMLDRVLGSLEDERKKLIEQRDATSNGDTPQ